MTPTEVLLVAGGWHDETPGGANKLPTDFARFLAGRGYRTTYVCPSACVQHPTTSVIDGVTLRRYPAPAAPSPSFRNVYEHMMNVRKATHDVLSDGALSALLGHNQLQYFAAASVCPRRVRRCYAVHSPFVRELRENIASRPTLRQRLSLVAAAGLERHLLAVSDIVHCDSAYTRALMEADYSTACDGKIIVLPGWVDVNKFRPRGGRRSELRARLGAPWIAGVPTFFTLRRLVPRMGLETLIEAASLLAGDGFDFRVVIGGEGPERPRLETVARERGIADRVAFIGRVPEERLGDSFAAADCFVLPTRALECFGLIVLESYASGVPAIGVPVGSIPEVMGREFADWIADNNRAPALARRMADVLSGRLVADPARLRARAMEFEYCASARRHERVLVADEAARQ